MRLTRNEAIHDIREMLLTYVDDERSVCEEVARRGIFCHGLSRWSLAELERRFPEIAREHPGIGRVEFVRLAHRWLLEHQATGCGLLPCDLFALRRESCAGWNEFYEAELAHVYEELFGLEIQVVPDELDGRG